MNIALDILKAIANLILPKNEVDNLPPHIIRLPKYLVVIINDTEPLDEPERSESAYYLLTQQIVCRQCGYSIWIPFGKIPEELYIGCGGDESCFHDFETVIDKDKRRLKASWLEIPAELHCEELIKAANPYEGIFYFNDSCWKIKSGKSVYTLHLDEIY